MREERSIKVNAVLNIIYTLTNIAFPLITYPYVSRILSPDGLGRVNFFSSISSYAEMIAALGLSTYGIRAVAKVRNDKGELSQVISELLCINYICTGVIIIIYVCLCINMRTLNRDIALCIINGIEIIIAPLGIGWLYFGLEQYSYITKRNIFFRCISLMLIFILVKEKTDYVIYGAIIVFSSVGSCFINFFYAIRLKILRTQERLDLIYHIKPLLVLFASALAVSVYINLDTVMLGFICDDREVGLYSMAVKIKTILLQLVNAVSTVLLPRMSYYFSQNKMSEYNKILKKSFDMIFIITIPLSIFFIIESYRCVIILGGNDFGDASVCMKILMVVLIFSGFSNILGNQILIPRGNEDCFMKAVVCGAFADIFLNIFFMPRYGCVGAAIATLCAEIIQMSVQWYYSCKYVPVRLNLLSCIKICISVFVSGLLITYFNLEITHNSILQFTINGILFGMTYIILLIITKEHNTFEIGKEIYERYFFKKNK